jgi:hypothetical protein
MNDVGLFDDGVSEIPAEVLWCAKVNLSAAQKIGKFKFKSRQSEEAHGGSRLELDKHINVTLRSEIRTQNGSKERKPAYPVSFTEFGYLFGADLNCWRHVSTSPLS